MLYQGGVAVRRRVRGSRAGHAAPGAAQARRGGHGSAHRPSKKSSHFASALALKSA
jgi:hypothetical protein